MQINTLFQSKKPLIGMVHLPRLNDVRDILVPIQKAIADIKALGKAGFNGVLLENYNDDPEYETVTPMQAASMAMIAWEVSKICTIPFGVQLLLNDWEASLAICRLTKASFTRLDVFVDNVTGKWGDIYPETDKIMAYKKLVCPDLLLFTDVQVKHKQMIDPAKTLEQSVQEAVLANSDGIVVTSSKTGEETPMETIRRAKAASGDRPVLIGAGVSAENIVAQLSVADAAIVGTSIMTNGAVDLEKAKKLVALLQTELSGQLMKL